MASVSPLQSLDPPADMNENGPVVALRATLYMIALESDYPAGHEVSFRAPDGAALHQASKAFLNAAKIQGTAQLNDGRMLMIVVRKKGAPRWKVSPYRNAVGASGCKLVAFRSVAVDRRLVPLGSRLIIEETRGMKLPDGEVHDGVWYAVDTGGKIRNSRIDLFVGPGKSPLSIPIKHGIKHMELLKVRISEQTHGCQKPERGS